MNGGNSLMNARPQINLHEFPHTQKKRRRKSNSGDCLRFLLPKFFWAQKKKIATTKYRPFFLFLHVGRCDICFFPPFSSLLVYCSSPQQIPGAREKICQFLCDLHGIAMFSLRQVLSNPVPNCFFPSSRQKLFAG